MVAVVLCVKFRYWNTDSLNSLPSELVLKQSGVSQFRLGFVVVATWFTQMQILRRHFREQLVG
jgi:uncharacterized membrane protein YwzB